MKKSILSKKTTEKGTFIHSFKGETVDFFLKKSSDFVVQLYYLP